MDWSSFTTLTFDNGDDDDDQDGDNDENGDNDQDGDDDNIRRRKISPSGTVALSVPWSPCGL